MNRLAYIAGILTWCFTCSAGHLEVGQSKSFNNIKEAIAVASPGDTIEIFPGIYREGRIEIDKKLVITGIDYPVLDGENEYEIIRILADSVTISGIVLKDVGVSYVEDRSAIRIVHSKHCVIESNRLENAFFGPSG